MTRSPKKSHKPKAGRRRPTQNNQVPATWVFCVPCSEYHPPKRAREHREQAARIPQLQPEPTNVRTAVSYLTREDLSLSPPPRSRSPFPGAGTAPASPGAASSALPGPDTSSDYIDSDGLMMDNLEGGEDSGEAWDMEEQGHYMDVDPGISGQLEGMVISDRK
jgi:hypothetical protein